MQQEQLFFDIFGRAEEEWDNKSFLKEKLDAYPYFGLAHFYLFKKCNQNENNNGSIAAKTELFFNNPYYLQALLTPQLELQSDNSSSHTQEEIIENKEADRDTIENSIIKYPTNKKVGEKEELLFEPLYTTDYFASQGIKLSEANLGDDKLGKQLKSFTSWLKTMKKVHPDKLPFVTALVEATVQNQAAKSNVDEEIVTEAMAEAFIKQDKIVRAIDTYQKLSLLDPAKSAYFAAKIETLKL